MLPKKRPSIFKNQKPQVTARSNASDAATAVVAEWLRDEASLQWGASVYIAEELVYLANKAFKASVAPTAVNVIVSQSEAVDAIVWDCKVLADKMDESGELGALMDKFEAQQDREELAKHGM